MSVVVFLGLAASGGSAWAQATGDPAVRPAAVVLPAPEIRRPDPAASATASRGAPSRTGPSLLGLATLSLAALGVGGWVARRRGSGGHLAGLLGRERGGSAGGAVVPVRLVSRTSLTPRHALHVVEAGGRRLLIGTGATGAPTLLAELDSAAGPAVVARASAVVAEEEAPA